MSGQPADHLRHDAARRRAGARLLDADRREAASWRASSRRSAWTSSRPAFRSRPRPTPRRCGTVATHVARPGRSRRSPAAAAADIDRAGVGARAGRAARRIHIFIATSDLHLERKLRMTREALPRRPRSPPSAAPARTPTTCSSRRRTRRAAIRTSCATSSRRSSRPARTTINLPDTVGYSTPDEIGAFFAAVHRPRAELRPGDLQRALPRRPRPGGRQHAGGDRRRRAPGRVHDQRHRRARRQRVARGNRHGDARPARSAAVRRPASTPAQIFAVQPAADRAHRRSASRPTRRSSAATPSRTRPASTRTAC